MANWEHKEEQLLTYPWSLSWHKEKYKKILLVTCLPEGWRSPFLSVLKPQGEGKVCGKQDCKAQYKPH